MRAEVALCSGMGVDQDLLEFTLAAARAAGCVLLEHFEGELTVTTKSSDIDLVTSADRAAEAPGLLGEDPVAGVGGGDAAGDGQLGGAVGRRHEVDVRGLGGDGELGLEVLEEDDTGGAGGGEGELEEAGVFGHAGG